MGSGARVAADRVSAAAYERAVELMPGGVNSPVRAMRAIGRDPIFVARGEGAELIDVDGNRYVDWVMSWGPLIAGHAHPEVVSAVSAAAAAGTSFGAPTEAEVELAAEVVERVPSAEMVRMTSSGTEASMSALRLARAATGRDRIVKFAGAYHGHVDGLLAEAGSGLATQGIPASPGVTEAQAADTVVGRLERRAAGRRAGRGHLRALPGEHGPGPAGRGLPPGAARLRGRDRRAADLRRGDHGLPRGPGGAQELEGVTPDLTVLGKIIGGGLPAAAYAGRRDLMEPGRARPATCTRRGRSPGNPLATAAGLATLRLLDESAYARARPADARSWRPGSRRRPRDAGSRGARGVGTAGFSRSSSLPRHRATTRRRRPATWTRTPPSAAGCSTAGVYLPPSQFEAWFPSLAHTDEHVARTVDAAGEVLRSLA